MKLKMHLLGTGTAVLLSVYAVTAYAGQEIREHRRSTEDLLMPEIRYGEADGAQGYYKTSPEVRIIHRQSGAVTKYELQAADHTKKQGSLELMEGQGEESIYLAGEAFQDGENILRIWMEKNPEEPEENKPGEDGSGEIGSQESGSTGDGSGTEGDGAENSSAQTWPEPDPELKGNPSKEDQPKEPPKEETPGENAPEKDPVPPDGPETVFEKEIRFRIDTKKPQKVHFSYSRAVREGSVVTNEPVELMLKSTDEGSGMEAIYYKTGDGSEGVLTGSDGSITLDPGFYGKVEACAVDRAGNRSEPETSVMILCENRPPELRIEAEGSMEAWRSDALRVNVSALESSVSSGIQCLKCYVGGEVVLHRENEYQTGITSMEDGFTVDLLSEGGKGIPVVVEALDWAGNFSSETRQVYIDKTAPAIQSEGIHDHMITGEPVKGRIRIREENDLASASMKVWKITSDKKRELITEKKQEPEPFSGARDIEWEIALEEDGTYEIRTAAKDRAGHESIQGSQVIVDGTSPVIRYVDQMQGVFVPYFQWNYGKEEVVQDETDYSYDISLDGVFYTTGKKITKEGARLLQVKAVDAAGNESTAEAVFQIDHTPPRIRISDVEDGSSYEDMAAVSISVDGKGEVLKEIDVNSEKMRLETGCQIFTRSFQEPGDYQIQILAEDLAGNQQREQVTFRIEERKQLAGGAWKPITRIFRNTDKSPARSAQAQDTEQEKSPAVLWLMLCFGLAVSAFLLRQKILYRRWGS